MYFCLGVKPPRTKIPVQRVARPIKRGLKNKETLNSELVVLNDYFPIAFTRAV